MQHAYDHAKKKGFIEDPKEIDDNVATGPKKPSSGKTNRYILGTNKKKRSTRRSMVEKNLLLVKVKIKNDI